MARSVVIEGQAEVMRRQARHSKTIAARACLAGAGADFDDEMTSLRFNDEMTGIGVMARSAVIEGQAEVMRRQARHSKTIAACACLAGPGADFDDEMTSLRFNDEMTGASGSWRAAPSSRAKPRSCADRRVIQKL